MSKKKIALGILSSVLMLGSMGTMLYFGIKGGKSPYDIAVENGFTGSQEDWLASLQGQNGSNGLDGQNGRDGVNGQDGSNGLNGTNGLNGNDGLNGRNGLEGPVGETGAKGEEGLTPYIDEVTGNWFIGTQDTGIHAEGPKGETPKLERRASSFNEIYNEIIDENEFDISLFDVENGDMGNLFSFKNIEEAEEYYNELGGTYISFNFSLENIKTVTGANPENNKTQAWIEGYYKFINIEHDGIKDVALFIDYDFSQYSQSEGIVTYAIELEADYIDGKYYVMSNFETLVNGRHLDSQAEELCGYYKISRQEYIDFVAVAGYCMKYASTCGVIAEFITNFDYQERSLDQNIGIINLELFSMFLPFAESYFEDNKYTFDFTINDFGSSYFDLNIGLERDATRQETSFKENSNVVYNDGLNTITTKYVMSRLGVVEKNPELTFERTTKIEKSMTDLSKTYGSETMLIYRTYSLMPLYTNLADMG